MKARIPAVMAALLTLAGGLPARAEAPLGRGAYLVEIMGCGDCHTPGHFLGKPDMAHRLSGSDVGFMIPGLGYFWGSNLTSDSATGLGKWSKAEIVTALRKGLRPDGRMLAPSMPWRSFAAMTDADAMAVATYLKSLPPVARRVPGPLGPDAKPDQPYLMVKMPQ